MTGMPASEVLYGYTDQYKPNSMHQTYLDGIPQMLADLAKEKGYAGVEEMAQKAFGTAGKDLEAYAVSTNRAYMYFTHLSQYIEPTEEALDGFCAEQGVSDSGDLSVDIRQILLVPQDVLQKDDRPSWQQKQEPREPVVLETVAVAPDGKVTCSEEAWRICEEEAQKLLTYWYKKTKGTEATFGETARKMSKDTGMYETGGLYRERMALPSAVGVLFVLYFLKVATMAISALSGLPEDWEFWDGLFFGMLTGFLVLKTLLATRYSGRQLTVLCLVLGYFYIINVVTGYKPLTHAAILMVVLKDVDLKKALRAVALFLFGDVAVTMQTFEAFVTDLTC